MTNPIEQRIREMKGFDLGQMAEGRYEELIKVKKSEGNVYRIVEEDKRKGTRYTLVNSDTREEGFELSSNVRHSLLRRLKELEMPEGVLIERDIFLGKKDSEIGSYDEIPFAVIDQSYLSRITPEGREKWEKEGPYSWFAVLKNDKEIRVHQIIDASHRGYVAVPLSLTQNSLEEAIETAERLSNLRLPR